LAAAGKALKRAGAILDELLATLDPAAGEIAGHLAEIYIFCKRELLAELREAWATIAAAPPETTIGRPALGATGAQA